MTTIKAVIDEFRKVGILAKGEKFEDQVQYDVLMDLVPIANKCNPSQLKQEVAKLLAKRTKEMEKTEGLYQDYLAESKSKYFKHSNLKEHFDAMQAPFYRAATKGGETRYLYDGVVSSSGISASTLHSKQMATVEEAYAFRKAYLPLYIAILQDILQNA